MTKEEYLEGCIIIDDPFETSRGYTLAERERINERFSKTLSSRSKPQDNVIEGYITQLEGFGND